jgi:hypothetical protein
MLRTLRVARSGCPIVVMLLLAACGGGGPTSSGIGSPAPAPAPSPTAADTTPPALAITAPSSSGTYTASGATVPLAGTASDNVGVVRVSWRNAATGAGGDASGSSNWSVGNVTLASGVNTITITARDAAGNAGDATLAVSYSPSGPARLSGRADSSLINRSGVNAVYIYNGSVTPDDLGGGGAQPLATAPVTQDNGACTFGYRFDTLAAGTYTVAFTNQAANDNPATDDAITFTGTATVTIPATGGIANNFLPVRILQVGPTRALTKPSAAVATARDGDVIEIDTGVYDGDVASWSANNLTLRGVGGRAHMRANGADAQGKGTWVISGNNTTVENIEFSGAAVPDLNGAGIRADGPNLTICNSSFHDNQEGILGGAGEVLIEYSEFSHNGNCIDPSGCAHNIYIASGTNKFTLRYSYSHHAHEGHNVKSRAKANFILYNRIMDEADGDASYEIDLPDCGRSFIIGNLIQKGPSAGNSTLVPYGAEGCANGDQQLYVANNTFVNDRGSGSFLSIRSGTTVKIVNNIFSGGGSVPSGAGVATNLVSNAPGLVDIVNFDYRLTAASAARDAGTDPGSAAGVSLVPTSQYVHPAGRQDRPSVGQIDIGAYEFSP